jgi:hypothetical protein
MLLLVAGLANAFKRWRGMRGPTRVEDRASGARSNGQRIGGVLAVSGVLAALTILLYAAVGVPTQQWLQAAAMALAGSGLSIIAYDALLPKCRTWLGLKVRAPTSKTLAATPKTRRLPQDDRAAVGTVM